MGALELEMPEEPILQLLMDKRYNEALPFVRTVIEDYYIKQHKKHTTEIAPYQKLLDNMDDGKWIKFLQLIEWNFGEANEQVVRANVIERVKGLCLVYDVDTKHVNSIVAELIDMIESRTFEKDFLKRIVHVGEVKSLFLEKAMEAKVQYSLDPIHIKWEKIQCDDIRNLKDKIFCVCPEFDSDELDFMADEYADGAFEQKQHNDVRVVKAFNYRIYKVCRNIIRKKIKEHKSIFTAIEITDLIDELVAEAEGLIKDKAQTYNVAFKDSDMVKKQLLFYLKNAIWHSTRREYQMNSKKRLMFILEDDYYFITLKVLAILKALDCERYPFEDYRKLGIIFEFIKEKSNMLFLEKLITKPDLDIFDNSRVVNISCNAKMNTAVIKRVLVFLEKQNMVTMKKSLKGKYIDIFLAKTPQLYQLISEKVLDDDLAEVALIKKCVPRVRTLKISSFRKKIFGTSEVSSWED